MCNVLGKNSWCSSIQKQYQTVYIDANGTRYCIFHAPVGRKYKPLMTNEKDGEERPITLINSKGERKQLDDITEPGEEWFASETLYSDQEFSELVLKHVEKFVSYSGHKDVLALYAEDKVIHISNKPRPTCIMSKAVLTTDINFSANEPIRKLGMPALDFTGSKFYGKINFDKVTIKGTVNFNDCIFHDSISFEETKFCESISFKRSEHKGELRFIGNNIDGAVLFDNCKCNSISFEGIQLTHNVYLGGATFDFLSFKNVSFKKNLNLNHLNVKKKFSLNECTLAGLNIRNATFDEEASFVGSNFSDCFVFNADYVFNELILHDNNFPEGLDLVPNFLDHVDIKQCHTKDVRIECSDISSISIDKCNITCAFICEDSNIKETIITDTAVNSYLRFKNGHLDNTRIEELECAGRTKFNNVVFDEITIADSTFRDVVFWESTTVNSNLEMNKSSFYSYVYFIDSIFKSVSKIKHIAFQKSVFFNKSRLLNEFSFYGTSCSECISFEGMELRYIAMAGAPIEKMNFQSCSWDGAEGKRSVFDEEKLLRNKEFSVLEDIYRRLKRVSQESKDELEVSAWHYKEKEMIRMDMWGNYDQSKFDFLKNLAKLSTQLNKKLPKVSMKRDYFTRMITYLYWIFSGYGEKPFNCFTLLLILSFVVPVFLSGFYWSEKATLPWTWFVPFLGDSSSLNSLGHVNPNSIPASAYFAKNGLNLLTTINAALLAFAIRNKLRR